MQARPRLWRLWKRRRPFMSRIGSSLILTLKRVENKLPLILLLIWIWGLRSWNQIWRLLTLRLHSMSSRRPILRAKFRRSKGSMRRSWCPIWSWRMKWRRLMKKLRISRKIYRSIMWMRQNTKRNIRVWLIKESCWMNWRWRLMRWLLTILHSRLILKIQRETLIVAK